MARGPELPTVVSPDDLCQAAQRAGNLTAWDFSAVRDWRATTNAEQWGQAQTFDAIQSAAPASGLQTLRAEEYEVEYALADIDSLVFILKYLPFPEPFDPLCHVDGVNRLLAESADERGVKTTEHRGLLVARKE